MTPRITRAGALFFGIPRKEKKKKKKRRVGRSFNVDALISRRRINL